MEFRWYNNPLYLVILTLCAALLLPALFMDGMFIDGLLYASVAKNYADGNGTFWFMTFSKTMHTQFHEQPPLMFVLQGTFFRIFGGSLYVERVYCLITALLTGGAIHRGWSLLTNDKQTAWLPVLFWFVMPVTFWAYTNNVEECTMGLFAMLAMNAIIRAVFVSPQKNYWWIIAGAWLVAAGLTKGVQGMFLLAAPFWVWIILRDGNFPKMVSRSVLIGAAPVLFVIIAWFTPSIHESFAAYFNSRYVKTFNNVTANSDNHFHILFELLLDILPVLFLVALFVLAGRKSVEFRTKFSENKRRILFFALCALSGILPLMVTREQRGFYLVTTLPMVAMTFALCVYPVAQRLTAYFASRKNWTRVFRVLSAAGLAAIIAVTCVNAGKPKRDADKIEALREIAAITGKNATITTDDYYSGEWSFITYAQRFHGIALTTYGHMPDADWQLRPKNDPAPAGFSAIPLKTPLFDLYQRQR